jgi:hypothetical protein
MSQASASKFPIEPRVDVHLAAIPSSGIRLSPSPNLNLTSYNTTSEISFPGIGNQFSLISNNDLISSEVKMIRLRISDYFKEPVLESIIYKLWRLMLEVQYEKTLLKAVSHLGHIPIAIEVYDRIIPLFCKAFGIYYQSLYYIAKKPEYKQETVFFDRFCYDFISLLGVNLLFLDIKNLEQIVR